MNQSSPLSDTPKYVNANQSDWRERYYAYLQTDEWKEKRDQRLAISHYRCAACESTVKLHVHHLTYMRVFREEMADLLPLCDDHHTTAEALIKSGRLSRTGNVIWLATETVRLLISTPTKKQKVEIVSVHPLPGQISKREARRLRGNVPRKIQKALAEDAEFLSYLKGMSRVNFKNYVTKKFGCGTRETANALTMRDRWDRLGELWKPE